MFPKEEKLISLRELGKKINRHYNTVLKLTKTGYYSLGGRLVHLEVIRTPSGMRTTVEAWYRFLKAINQV